MVLFQKHKFILHKLTKKLNQNISVVFINMNLIILFIIKKMSKSIKYKNLAKTSNT